MKRKYIDYKGYTIDVDQIPHNGMYRLSTWMYSAGEEYIETMLTDTLSDDVYDKFIQQVESGR